MSIAKWSVQAACIAAFAVAAAGCEIEASDHRREPRPVYVQQPGPPQPVYVEPAPPPPQPMVVQEAPPPPQVEAIPAVPGPGFVWVGGYWTRQGPSWVWVRGRYDRPPHPGMRWEVHHWEKRGDGFHLVVGGWR